jgi:hypothetical protein
MAIIYFTFTFSPARFDSWLCEQVVVDGRVDYERLEALARGIAAEPSPDTVWALTAMRYGDEWFDPQWFDDPFAQGTRSYLIALAAQMRRVVGPDWPMAATLGEALAQLGWSSKQVSLLINGDSIGTLDAVHDLLLREAFAPGSEGGWLDLARISGLYSQLTAFAETFLAPSRQFVMRLQERSRLTGVDEPKLVELLRAAYLTTEGMLATALVRREALYLVLD